MILYNGHTGSIGRYFEAILKTANRSYHILNTRLENNADLHQELSAILFEDIKEVTLVQLAAIVSVSWCEKNPTSALEVNVNHTQNYVSNLIKFFKENHAEIKLVIIYVSTSHVYKSPTTETKITALDETDPKTVYARTKLICEKSLYEICIKQNIQLIIARVFGVVAENQPEHYILPALIKRVTTENLENIKGLKNIRDYLDSRDICATLLKIIDVNRQKPAPQILNICSGNPISIEEFLILILTAMNKNHLLNHVTASPSEYYDSPWIVGDPTETEAYIGDKIQKITTEKTIRDALLQGI